MKESAFSVLYPDDCHSTSLRNFGKHLPEYVASHPRRWRLHSHRGKNVRSHVCMIRFKFPLHLLCMLMCIAKGCEPDARSLIPGKGKRFISSPQRPELLLWPTEPPIQWTLGGGVLSLGVKRPGVKSTTHLHLVPRSGMVQQYLHSPIRVHDVLHRGNFIFMYVGSFIHSLISGSTVLCWALTFSSVS
jgi:hypothetical protein